MNDNQKIEAALAGLVNGNIWPLDKPANEDPDEFIVYNPENEYLDYGDDKDQEAQMAYQIHWFKRGHANYVAPRRQIRGALREAGFLIEPSPFLTYESDSGNSSNGTGTGWTHMVIVTRTDEE